MLKIILIISLLLITTITFSQEPQSPSDLESWILINPHSGDIKFRYAWAQFSNDPTFQNYVEGRVNSHHPDGRFSGPYTEGIDDNYYKYARTKKEWMIPWEVRNIKYTIGLTKWSQQYDYGIIPTTFWPPNSEKLQAEVKKYFDDQFKEQKKRYEARIIAEDYKRQQDGLKRRKADLEKQLKEIEAQIEN